MVPHWTGDGRMWFKYSNYVGQQNLLSLFNISPGDLSLSSTQVTLLTLEMMDDSSRTEDVICMQKTLNFDHQLFFEGNPPGRCPRAPLPMR